MVETIAGRKNFENLFTFPEGIALREMPRRRMRFGIYEQPSATFTIHPHPHHKEETEQLPARRAGETGKEGSGASSKIGKGLLRECHASVVACLSELIESLSALSLQLLQLHVQSSQQMALSVLHQRTIDLARQAINQLPSRSSELNNDYSQLLSACKEISTRISLFKREFRLQKQHYQLPSQSKIFNSLLE